MGRSSKKQWVRSYPGVLAGLVAAATSVGGGSVAIGYAGVSCPQQRNVYFDRSGTVAVGTAGGGVELGILKADQTFLIESEFLFVFHFYCFEYAIKEDGLSSGFGTTRLVAAASVGGSIGQASFATCGGAANGYGDGSGAIARCAAGYGIELVVLEAYKTVFVEGEFVAFHGTF